MSNQKIQAWSLHLQVVIVDSKRLQVLSPQPRGFKRQPMSRTEACLYKLVHSFFLSIAEAFGVRIYIVDIQEGPLEQTKTIEPV